MKFDTNKVWVYRDLAYYHLEEHLDSSIYYSQHGFLLASSINFHQGKIWNLYQKALALEFSDRFSDAIDTFQFALSLADQIGDKKSVAKIKNSIGAAYYYQSDYTKSIQFYQEAFLLSEEINYFEGKAYALNNLGIIYRHRRDFSKALETYQKSKDLKLLLQDSVGVLNSEYNMGILYSFLNDYERSLQAFNRAENLAILTKDNRNKATIKIGKGAALYNLEMLDEAYINLEEGLKELKPGSPHEKIGALAYFGILKIKKGLEDAGLKDLLLADEMVRQTDRLELKKQVSKELATAYELIGSPDLAVKYWRRYNEVNDSINTEQKQWAFEEMQAKFGLIEKDKQIQMQEAALRAEINRRYFGLALLTLLFFSLVFVGYKKMIGLRKVQLLEIESIKSKAPAQLRKQMDFSMININLPTPLTEREIDVIGQLELGLSNQEIARKLYVSENTIKTHLKNIFIKTEAQSRTDLIHRLKLFSENVISD
ncbi:tetratricopeptide repeat protein [Belliella marina]|uniref:Tetratricopeptide repeat protein n=1 Tax=Belliella marina TaxID=1644146 RepID=A0ABW4VRY8_9BACT